MSLSPPTATGNRTTLTEGAAAGLLRRTATSHIGLRVPDVPAATVFYERVLGLVRHAEMADGGARLGWGGGHHVLDLLPGDPALDHIAFEVRDPGGLDGVEKRLRSAGLTVSALDESYLDSLVDPAGAATGLVCTDPDGNTVQFHAPVRTPPTPPAARSSTSTSRCPPPTWWR